MDIFGEEDGYQPNTDIYAVPISMTVGGSKTDLDYFINRVLKIDKRVLVTGYTWGEYRYVTRKDAEGNIIPSSVSPDDGIVRKTLTIRLELYMCDTENISVSEEAQAAAEEEAAVNAE